MSKNLFSCYFITSFEKSATKLLVILYYLLFYKLFVLWPICFFISPVNLV
jgi:hypothetical protein